MGVSSGEAATTDEVELLLKEEEKLPPPQAPQVSSSSKCKTLTKSTSIDVRTSGKFRLGSSAASKSIDHLCDDEDDEAKSALLTNSPSMARRKSRSSNAVSSWAGANEKTFGDGSCACAVGDPEKDIINLTKWEASSHGNTFQPKSNPSSVNFRSSMSRSVKEKSRSLKTRSLKLKLSYKSSLPKLDTVPEPGLPESSCIDSQFASGFPSTAQASPSPGLGVSSTALRESPSSSAGSPRTPASLISRSSRSVTKSISGTKMAVFRSNSDSKRIRGGFQKQRFRHFSLRTRKLAWDEVSTHTIYIFMV